MKNRQRNRKYGKPNRVRHYSAIENPRILALLRKLKAKWHEHAPVELGMLVDELLQQGLSTRGLAEELKNLPEKPRVSATTLRRYVQLAKLPEVQKEAIRKGSSKKRILAEEDNRKRQQRAEEEALRRKLERQRRLKLEKETGLPSDELAKTICSFCIDADPVLVPDEVDMLFSQASTYLRGTFVESDASVEGLELAFLELKAQQLADLLLAEPERTIRQAASTKALKLIGEGFEARKGDVYQKHRRWKEQRHREGWVPPRRPVPTPKSVQRQGSKPNKQT